VHAIERESRSLFLRGVDQLGLDDAAVPPPFRGAAPAQGTPAQCGRCSRNSSNRETT
jgi:hypothetical protein